MKDPKEVQNNQATVRGEVVSGFAFSHEISGEKFYLFDLLVQRLSDQDDTIPIMVSERLIDVTSDFVGQYLEVSGQFRSYNKHEERKNRLVLSVFAREVVVLEEEPGNANSNTVDLTGYLCKAPVYRKTPLGREIADVLLAVNRPYGKSDYIPCIFWGRNARYMAEQSVGTQLNVVGRIQSREYVKQIPGTEETEKRVAYEVSISKFSVIEDE